MLENQIKTILDQYPDPYLNQTWAESKVVKTIVVEDDLLHIELNLGYPAASILDVIKASVEAYLKPHTSKKVNLSFDEKITAHSGRAGMVGFSNIKNIIAVGSGKGGVGKSTVAINMAIALLQEGARVGLLDADIYGPSQPTMLGVKDEKPPVVNKRLQPIMRHGLQTMSMGYLIGETTPMVWRGPMIGKALQQLLTDSDWDNLDYLIIDLPPGTGDVQLTLCQKMPVTGSVIVTTPQDLALQDVRRACEMFTKLNVPLIGVIENMSYFSCARCGHEHHLFGQGGGDTLATEYKIGLLGSVPIDMTIREQSDNGNPVVAANPQSVYAQLFREIARKAAGKLATRSRDYSARFPKIVTE